MSVDLTKEHFPFLFHAKTIQIEALTLFAKLKDDVELKLSVTPADSDAEKTLIPVGNKLGGLCQATWSYTSQPKIPGTWLVTVTSQSTLSLNALEDIGILCHYSVQEA